MQEKPQGELSETQLQALLRLKRHEQPPPGYFDDLLHSVQRRQREEMLRRPAWRIFIERVAAFLTPLRREWAYAASMATILIVGISIIQIAIPRTHQPVAKTTSPQTTTVAATATTMEARKAKRPAQPGQPVPPTRFIIESQPASYEQTQIRF